MTLSEKVAYLRGLKAGLSLNADRPETKMFNAILDVLDDVAISIDNTNDAVSTLQDQVLEVDSDLGQLESMLYFADLDDLDDAELEDVLADALEQPEEEAPEAEEAPVVEPEAAPAEEVATYEIECPNCGEKLYVEEATLLAGGTVCPGCGEVLEFEIELED